MKKKIRGLALLLAMVVLLGACGQPVSGDETVATPPVTTKSGKFRPIAICWAQ